MLTITCRVGVALAACCMSLSALAAQQSDDRRERTEPGMILTTSGRLGACDALTFTRDGQQLLATGDDKVVMQWTLNNRRELEPSQVPFLRWSTWREQRGAIYAMALSPDQEQRYVAVGGYGLKTGMLAVLDRVTGETYAAMTDIKSDVDHTIWSAAFSPDGKQVAYGADDGTVWRWSLDQNYSVQLGKHATNERFNFVKFVAFLGKDKLLSVAQSGHVLLWDLTLNPPQAKELFRFDMPSVFYVALSPDHKWLAAAADKDLKMLVEVRSVDGKEWRVWSTPFGKFAHSLAFDPQSQHLAVGTRNVAQKVTFYKELGGNVFIYDLNNPAALPREGPSVQGRAERMAFHPDGELLAVAGGDDQEITLWNLRQNPPKLLHTIRGQGRSVWGLTISTDGRFLGLRQEKEPDPRSPNHLAKETAWRAFDLHRRQFTMPAVLKDSLQPLETMNGWKIEPGRKVEGADRYENDWIAVGPDGKREMIPWDFPRDNLPQCYSFLPAEPGKPVRVAIGHYWGATIYELGNGPPRRVRKLIGHQCEVTSLVPSADGKLLYTGSRDQTVAAWSLLAWPSQSELGVRFILRNEGLEVESVDLGSPGWEAGLSPGDKVIRMAFEGKLVEGGPEAWAKVLRNPEPGKECYVEARRAGREKPVIMKTTVRQRPLWRFFTTTGGEWVLWRWRDYYYDCSASGDYFIGWQVTGKLNETPAFYRAEQFRRRFHRPDKVAELVTKGIVEPERVAFIQYEPPQVRLAASQAVVRDKDLTVKLTVRPRGDGDNLQPERMLVWVNDYLMETWAGGGEKTLTIPRAKLRRGSNVLVAQCYNKGGGRGEGNKVFVQYTVPEDKPKLFGVFVGVGKYPKSKPPQVTLSADIDAQGLYETWKDQKGSLYADKEMHLLLNDKATPEAVLQQLQGLAGKVGPDDRLVISLGGHGVSADELGEYIKKAKLQVVDELPPQSFAFVGPDFDAQRPNKTGLTSRDLYEAIIRLPCRKVILLDACHSGTVGISPVRELTRDGIGPVILAACSPDESAIEFSEMDNLKRANGLFTLAIIKALSEDFEEVDKDRNQLIDARELSSYVPGKVVKMVQQLHAEKIKGLEARKQNPQVFPPYDAERVALAGK
jgi:WD40 repeat protein